MSEDAPQLPPADESQRVEDPGKAHAMALAGDEERTRAAQNRQLANEAEHAFYNNSTDADGADRSEGLHRQIEVSSDEARFSDEQAHRLEEEAAKRYDSGEVVTPTAETPQSGPAENQAHEESQDKEQKKSPEEVQRRVGEIKSELSHINAKEMALHRELQQIDREHRELSQQVEHPDGTITVIEPSGEEWLRHSPTSGLWYSGPDDYVGQYD